MKIAKKIQNKVGYPVNQENKLILNVAKCFSPSKDNATNINTYKNIFFHRTKENFLIYNFMREVSYNNKYAFFRYQKTKIIPETACTIFF